MNQKQKTTFSDVIEERLESFFEMHGDNSPESGLYQRVISEVEKLLIKKTLDHTQGVQIKASQILGINRNTLRKKIKDLQI